METIAALVSGGVDSSVAVHSLVEQGYTPDLFYIKIGMEGFDKDFSCSQEEDLEMVKSIARKYALKYDIVDLQTEYWDYVVKYMLDAIKQGKTPNGDVMCNRLIKFGAFDEKIGKNYDKIMTGHYATTIQKDGFTWLGTGVDLVKDQTDFLCQLTYHQLSKSLFPIGHMSKNQVREIAVSNKLATATRKDSQGICFLGKINYRDFVSKYLGIHKGYIVEYETSKVLGEHNGAFLYTIGQRKGLTLSGGPWFVCKKDIEKNIVYVTRNIEIFKQTSKIIHINAPNWLTTIPFPYIGANLIDLFKSFATDLAEFDISFKIRHSPEFYDGKLGFNKGFFIRSNNEIGGVAPGQFCVIYNKEKTICYGGGEIEIK